MGTDGRTTFIVSEDSKGQEDNACYDNHLTSATDYELAEIIVYPQNYQVAWHSEVSDSFVLN